VKLLKRLAANGNVNVKASQTKTAALGQSHWVNRTGSIALGQSHWVGHKWGRLLCEDLVLAVTSQHHRRALQADRLGHHPLCRSLAFGC